jgi:hypothetical protein
MEHRVITQWLNERQRELTRSRIAQAARRAQLPHEPDEPDSRPVPPPTGPAPPTRRAEARSA